MGLMLTDVLLPLGVPPMLATPMGGEEEEQEEDVCAVIGRSRHQRVV